MFQKDVLEKCKELGHPITASNLYLAGYKYGFLTKKEGTNRLEFNKEKFLEYIEKATKEIPEGFVGVSEFAKSKGKSFVTIYNLIKEDESCYVRIGAGKGVIYVDPIKVEELIRKREEQHKEKW